MDSPDTEIIADPAAEASCKGACELRQTKRLSDVIMPHILNLYGSQATPRDFEIYDENASFEDPLMCAHGVKQIKSSFYSVSKLFSESRIVEYSITENVISPGKHEILIDNKQYYKFLGKDINMISLIKLNVVDGKVVRHEDWWDKKPIMNRETAKLPFVGQIVESTRRASMLITHAMMGSGRTRLRNNLLLYIFCTYACFLNATPTVNNILMLCIWVWIGLNVYNRII